MNSYGRHHIDNNFNLKSRLKNTMKLSKDQILQELTCAKAILKGHFILSSGLHSDTYIQCAKALCDPYRSQRLCSNLADKVREKLKDNLPDLVVSPAMGGVVVGYELARQLGIPAIFCERVNGIFELRRGFEIESGNKILVVEDVITTGKSSQETFDLIKKFGGQIVAEACLIDRSNDPDIEKKMACPVISLLEIEVEIFKSDQVPDNLKHITAIKPGSRFIKN